MLCSVYLVGSTLNLSSLIEIVPELWPYGYCSSPMLAFMCKNLDYKPQSINSSSWLPGVATHNNWVLTLSYDEGLMVMSMTSWWSVGLSHLPVHHCVTHTACTVRFTTGWLWQYQPTWHSSIPAVSCTHWMLILLYVPFTVNLRLERYLYQLSTCNKVYLSKLRCKINYWPSSLCW